MTFRVGQKVVAIKATEEILAAGFKPTTGGAVVGKIYTIRELEPRTLPPLGLVGLRLEGIMLPLLNVSGIGMIEKCFHPGCFRPVIEKSTELGMAILRKVADDASKQKQLTICGND